MEGERRREQMEGKETTGDKMKGIKSCCFIPRGWSKEFRRRRPDTKSVCTSDITPWHIIPPLSPLYSPVSLHLCESRQCANETLQVGITGGKSSFLFPLRSLSPCMWGGASGPNRAVRAEIDGGAVCLTLPPISDNKINLHSSTLMKVPRRHHLFLLFSSLSLSLSVELMGYCDFFILIYFLYLTLWQR